MPENRMQRVVGTELQSFQGDTIKYYKSNILGGGTSNSDLICRRKYLEMLRTTVESSLEVMECDFDKDILGHRF